MRLEPLRPADYEALFRAEIAFGPGGAWRFGGRTPSFREYVGSLWGNVLGACAVRRGDGTLVGSVAAYDADHRNGVVWIMAQTLPGARGSGLVLLGLGHLVTELFSNWPFRLVLAESTETGYRKFGSGMHRSFEVQGRLTEHRFVEGRYCDQVYLAAERERWMAAEGRRQLRAQVRGADDAAPAAVLRVVITRAAVPVGAVR
jgi:hypothetical protein